MSLDMRETQSERFGHRDPPPNPMKSWMDSEKRLNPTQTLTFNEEQVKAILAQYATFHMGKHVGVENVKGSYRQAEHDGPRYSPASCTFIVTIG